MAENPVLNENGTVGEPAASGLTPTQGNGTAVQTNPSDRGDKSRYNTEAFLKAALGLANVTGWQISSPPVRKRDSTGATVQGNQYTVTATGPEGEVRTITITPKAGTDPASMPMDQVDWDIYGVEQTVKPQSPTSDQNKAALTTAQAAADTARANLEKIQQENQERDANKAKTGLALTDKEVADIKDQGVKNSLTQQQIDNALQVASNNNANSMRSNEIAAMNAVTQREAAEHQAKVDDLRVQVAQAGQATEEQKQKALELQNDYVNKQNDRRIALSELQQQQTNEAAQATAAAQVESNRLRGVEGQETTRHNQAAEAQAVATAQAQKDTAALNALSSMTTNQQTTTSTNARTGGDILNTRVNAGANMFGQALGAAQNKSILNWPSGAGEAFAAGVKPFLTDLGGGQGVYDSAAAMVQAANPAISQNQVASQQMYTMVKPLMDAFKQMTGRDWSPGDTGAPGGAGAAAATTGGTTGGGAAVNPNAVSTAIVAPNTGTAQGQQTTDTVNQALQAQQQLAALASPGGQNSTAALNARGLPDTPWNRAQLNSAVGLPANLAASPMLNTGPGMTIPYVPLAPFVAPATR